MNLKGLWRKIKRWSQRKVEHPVSFAHNSGTVTITTGGTILIGDGNLTCSHCGRTWNVRGEPQHAPDCECVMLDGTTHIDKNAEN